MPRLFPIEAADRILPALPERISETTLHPSWRGSEQSTSSQRPFREEQRLHRIFGC
jgi:hypothetical protein